MIALNFMLAGTVTGIVLIAIDRVITNFRAGGD